jgi:hypothetical protein
VGSLSCYFGFGGFDLSDFAVDLFAAVFKGSLHTLNITSKAHHFGAKCFGCAILDLGVIAHAAASSVDGIPFGWADVATDAAFIFCSNKSLPVNKKMASGRVGYTLQ